MVDANAEGSPLYLLAVIRPAEAGCRYMELAVDPQDDTTWYMFEKFDSRAAWDDHMLTEHVISGNEFLGDKLREPTELRLYSGK